MSSVVRIFCFASVIGACCGLTDVAEARRIRGGMRRCRALARRISAGPTLDVPVDPDTAIQREIFATAGLLPEYTRCVIVAREPDVDGAAPHPINGWWLSNKEVAALDPDPGLAFSKYLQRWFVLGNSKLGTFHDFGSDLRAHRVRYIVRGQANYFLRRGGPAGATEYNATCLVAFEDDFSARWRAIKEARPEPQKYPVRREGDVEFFQDGKAWLGFSAPNLIILGDHFEYFHDTVKAAVCTPPRTRRTDGYAQLISPQATFWFAHFLQGTASSPSSSSPTHAFEYVPNREWSCKLWLIERDGWGPSMKPGKTLDFDLVPDLERVPPLVAHGILRDAYVLECQFSLRNYDLVRSSFPLVLMEWMGIAIFI